MNGALEVGGGSEDRRRCACCRLDPVGGKMPLAQQLRNVELAQLEDVAGQEGAPRSPATACFLRVAADANPSPPTVFAIIYDLADPRG